MPALITHNYFSKQVLPCASNEIQAIVKANPCAFYLGAQGPDIFFTMHFEKNERKELGNRLHQQKIYQSFLTMIDYAKAERDNAFISYIFGYICHYALDVKVHPYVRYYDDVLYKTKPMNEKYERHIRLESGFDLVIIRDKLNENIFKYRAVKNVLKCSKAEENSIAKFYSKAGAAIYGLDISESKVKYCINTTRLFFNFAHDGTKSKIKYRIADRFEDLFKLDKNLTGFMRLNEEAKEEDWCNLRRDKFPEIYNSDKLIDSTFFELIDNAKIMALKLFDEVYGALYNNETLQKESFNMTFDGERQ